MGELKGVFISFILFYFILSFLIKKLALQFAIVYIYSVERETSYLKYINEIKLKSSCFYVWNHLYYYC